MHAKTNQHQCPYATKIPPEGEYKRCRALQYELLQPKAQKYAPSSDEHGDVGTAHISTPVQSMIQPFCPQLGV